MSTWRHIGLHGHNVGTLTIDSANLQWRSATNHTKIEASAQKLTSANFAQFGPVGHLVVTMTQGSAHNKAEKSILRFDGFRPSDFDRIKDLFSQYYDLNVTKKSHCSAGASFGVTDIQTNTNQLVFLESIIEQNLNKKKGQEDEDSSEEEVTETTGEEIMSLNLKDVSQCVLPGTNRNEIELQFHESDALNGDSVDQLVQIRFYVPPETDVSDPNDPTPAEFLQKRIMEAARIKSTTGEKILEFPEHQGTFLTPRGRYAIELYEGYLRLRGAKYDYKIKYDDLSRLFLLPKPDDIHYAFVIALDKPIRQGQQRYQYLILQCTKEQSEVTINLDEESLKNDYNNEIQPVMAGALSNLIAKTFKVITKKKVFIPGKFTTVGNSKCVKCALKANEGHLYPLEKQFLFIHKPAVLIRFEEIESVEFQRYAGGAGSTRNFDLCVSLKDTSSIMDGSKEYIFSGIDRSDYNALYSFLSSKKIRIKNLTSSLDADDGAKREPIYNENIIFGTSAGGEGSDSEEDEDYDANEQVSESSSSEDSGGESDNMSADDDSDLEEFRKAAVKAKRREAKETDDKGSSTPPRKKKRKDPNAPKGATSAFLYFAKATRDETKEANPDASFGELQKLIATAWKELSDEDKEPYNKQAASDKARYESEMKEYKKTAAANDDESDEETAEKATKKKKSKKDPNAPKRATTAYMLFVKDKRSEIAEKNPDASFAEIGKLLGTAFKALDESEKTKYDDMVAEDKERYAQEMKAYKEKQNVTSAADNDSDNSDSD